VLGVAVDIRLFLAVSKAEFNDRVFASSGLSEISIE
jgi:hypothetical protein